MAGLGILALSQARPVAPAGIWLEAANVTGFATQEATRGQAYDPSFHDITYTWRVIDSPLPAFTAPQTMVTDWNDPNRAYGKKVVFFFPRPGVYRVEVVAEDMRGTTARSEIDIAVADPDQVYAGARTICVSFDPGETWAGMPEGARRAASVKHIAQELRRSTEPARLRFRRGQTFTGIDMRLEGTQLGQLDAWGDGSPPVLKGVDRPLFQLHKRSKIRELTIADVHFEGAWDATTERGLSTTSPILWVHSPTPAHYAVWNCRFSGFDHLDFEVREVASSILIGNSTVTNWRNFGFLFRSPNARFALVGSCVGQDRNALHGGPKSGALSNTHGPIRITDCANVYIGASDFFSRTGWSGLDGKRADQPCLRLNTTGAEGSAFNMDRIVCEGGYHVINLKGSTPKIVEHAGNYLIDKALLIGTTKTIGPFIATDFGGLTVRNTLGILPNVPRHHGNRWQGALRTDMDNPAPGNAAAPVQVYSSSFLNLLDRRNDTGKAWIMHRGSELFDNTTYENNVLFDPVNGQGGITLAGSLPGVRPRYDGIRYNFRNQRGELPTSVAPGQGFEIPYAEITEDTWGTGEEDGTGPTTEAYWLETEKTDTWHMIAVRGVKRTAYAAFDQIEVIFGAKSVYVVNAGEDIWEAGARYELRLDRVSRVGPPDTATANPETLPIPRPAPGDPAYRSATAGRVALDDFFGRRRGATPSQGAFEPE